MTSEPWPRKRIVRTVVQNVGGHAVPLVLAVEGRRPGCSCRWFIGQRGDNGETCFVVAPCPQHLDASSAAQVNFKTRPPDDEEGGAVYEEAFEAVAANG